MRKYQDRKMSQYRKGNIALHVYMQSMGGFHISKEVRSTTDLDPDPFGDGLPTTFSSDITSDIHSIK